MEKTLSSLLQPDIVIPAQYFDTIQRTAYLEPEKWLMLAVLEDAVRCFQKYIFAQDRKGKALFKQAENWLLMEGENDWPFSFENVCEALGLAPGCLRQGLIQWKNTAQSAGLKYVQRKKFRAKAAPSFAQIELTPERHKEV